MMSSKKMITLFVLFVFQILFFGQEDAQAEVKHEVLRRLTVFPVYVDNTSKFENKEILEELKEIWWTVRDNLTETRRFLVASRYFLKSKDVFHPRKELSEADTVILGKLLDAHGLITMEYISLEKKLTMKIYDSKHGWSLWSKSLLVDSDRSLKGQLKGNAKKLVRSFIEDLPYDGYTISEIENEGTLSLVKVDFGAKHNVVVGSKVKFISLKDKSLQPLFQQGGIWQENAEGEILSVDNGIARIELLTSGKKSFLKKYSLVKIYKEDEKMANGKSPSMQALEDRVKINGKKSLDDGEKKIKKPLVSALVFLGNLVLFLVLAF